MKAVVTGGCGFIGSHLTELLLQKGYEVVIIDNLSNGSLDNVSHLKDYNLKVIIQDISDLEGIKEHFDNVDYVFHLAALADIVPSIEEPLKYHKSNVTGSIAVLEASRMHKVKRVVYAASSSCYGIPDKYPTDEKSTIKPEYPYATTKYIGEQYVLNWSKVYDLPVTSLRFFNVYGTRSRTSGTYGAVFGVFLAQKINGKPFTVVGDGTQTRDFTYVTDVAKACFEAATNPKALNQVFNVGSGDTYSINYLTELLGGDKIYIPKRPGEPDCTFADISKITEMLDWRPQVKLDEGVSMMLDNLDYWQDAPVWDESSIKSATESWFKYLK